MPAAGGRAWASSSQTTPSLQEVHRLVYAGPRGKGKRREPMAQNRGQRGQGQPTRYVLRRPGRPYEARSTRLARGARTSPPTSASPGNWAGGKGMGGVGSPEPKGHGGPLMVMIVHSGAPVCRWLMPAADRRAWASSSQTIPSLQDVHQNIYNIYTL